MAFGIVDLVQGIIASRAYFLKHVRGMTDEQWIWKPYPECKSGREILQHLIIDDMAALDSLKTGAHPDYESFAVSETDIGRLLTILEKTHKELVDTLRDLGEGKSLEDDICIWGDHVKLGRGVPHLSSEDYYHAGQIAYIRMATDPNWDYYTDIYGTS